MTNSLKHLVSDDETEIDRSLKEELDMMYELQARCENRGVAPLEPDELDSLNDLAHIMFQMLIYDVRFLAIEHEDTATQVINTMADNIYHLRGILNSVLISANPSFKGASLADFEDAFDNIETCKRNHPILNARWNQPFVEMTDPEFSTFLEALVGSHSQISYWADETEQLLLVVEVSAYDRFFLGEGGFQREQRRLRYLFMALFRCTAYCQNLSIEAWTVPAEAAPSRARFEAYFKKFIRDTRMTDPQEQVLISMIQRVFILPGETEYFEMCYPNDRASAPAMLVAFRPKEQIDKMTDLLDMPLPAMYENSDSPVRFCVMRLMVEVVFLLNTPLDLNEYVLENPDLDVLHSTEIAIVKIINTYVVLADCKFYFPSQDPMDVFFAFFWLISEQTDNKLDDYDMTMVMRLWDPVMH